MQESTLDSFASKIVYIERDHTDYLLLATFQVPMRARYDIYTHISEQLKDDLTKAYYDQFKPDTVGRAG